MTDASPAEASATPPTPTTEAATPTTEADTPTTDADTPTTDADTAATEAGPASTEDTAADNKEEVQKEEDLVAQVEQLDVNSESAPDLHSGELLVRQAGKAEGECDVNKVTSFSELNIDDKIKEAIIKNKGWQSMSKIQQIGLPLLLSNPPMHMVAQAQAGTGKTGTFVIGLLGRITDQVFPSAPQGIILAGTQELVTQIAMEVNALGQFKGISARRVMSAGKSSSAPWDLARGEDFSEQVVVGTPGKVKNLLNNAAKKRPTKPLIDASQCRVLVLDEADTMVQPKHFGSDTTRIRQMILRARKSEVCQILLFSATFTESVLPLVHEFVGNDPTKFHEITLHKKDITLDKVVNFFVTIGEPSDSPQIIEQKKREGIIAIWESLADCNTGQTVIFVNSKRSAQQLADFLRAEGHNVGQIHGDMEKHEREVVFKEFVDGKRPALVATNILSRGIDNLNVTLVINVDLPNKMSHYGGAVEADPDTFVHRIGRSGRWTKRGASVSFVSMNPQSSDKDIMKEIERVLFANEAVNRPLIHVADPSKVGDALKQEDSLQATLGLK